MDKKAEILDRAARRAIIHSGVEKRANIFGKGKDFLTRPIASAGKDAAKGWTPMKLLGAVAAGVITNQFVKRLIDAGEKKGIEMKSPYYYQKMLKAHPELMEENEDEVLRGWQTLYKTAPHLAQDPIAAGGFIRSTISSGFMSSDDLFGAPPLDHYKTLTELEKNIKSNRDSGAANAFSALAGALSAGAAG